MRTLVFLLLLTSLAPLTEAQPGPAVPLPDGTKVLKDVPYVPGGHERQKLDLYLDTPDSPDSQLVGGPIRDNPEKVARANPVTYVTPDDPPFLIVHGDADLLVPYHQSVLLKEALRKAGVQVRLATIPGGPHGGETVKSGLPIALDFLAEVLSSRPPGRASGILRSQPSPIP